MLQRVNPSNRPAPTGFAESTLVPAHARLLVVAGQVAVDPDGHIPDDIEAQTLVCWQNVLQLLQDAGTSIDHIVKHKTYLTGAQYIDGYRKARGQIVGGLKAPSTMVIVSALVNPKFLVEIEVTALVPDAV